MKDKMLHIIRTLLVAVMVLTVGGLSAQVGHTPEQPDAEQTDDIMQGDRIRVSLLVSEPSARYFHSIFGHAALRFECPELETDFTYTYVGERLTSQTWAYITGRLRMGLDVRPTDEYLEMEHRQVREYRMHLPAEQKRQLCVVLDREMRRGFCKAYDPICGSCSGMLFRYLAPLCSPLKGEEGLRSEKSLRGFRGSKGSKGSKGLESEEYDLTIRELVSLYARDYALSQWIYNTLAGGSYVEDPALPKSKKVMFPDQLLREWEQVTLDGQPLLDTDYTIIKAAEPYPTPWYQRVNIPLIIALLMVLTALLSLRYRPLQYIVLAAVTLLGLVMTYLLVISDLPHTEWNWLILPFNLLPAICWRWRRWWGLPYAGVLAVLLVVSVCWPHTLLLPAHQVMIAAEVITLGGGGLSTKTKTKRD